MVKISSCANPRGNLWLKDKNHVGFKLMQKMGWSVGQGLGSKEDGMKEAIKVRRKNDAKGVGYHNNSDNNWLDHQDEFNALLSKLNENNVELDHSKKMISLEEKSRSSKSRLHYHKYTRGKDLSSCSDKDLACILGKRKNDASKDASNVIINKMSSYEYFSQKQSLLEKNKLISDPLEQVPSLKKKHKRKKDVPSDDSEECLQEADSLQEDSLKKKKRDRKKDTSSHESEDGLPETEKEECDPLQTTQCLLKKKKHKRKKDVPSDDSEECLQEADGVLTVLDSLQEDCLKKKKRDRKKNTSSHESEDGLPETEKEECDPLQTTQCLLKKKKHKRKKETPLFSSEKGVKYEVKNELNLGTGEDTVLDFKQILRDGMTESLECKETSTKKCRNDERDKSTTEFLEEEVAGLNLKKRKRKLTSSNNETILEEDSIQENTEMALNVMTTSMEDKDIIKEQGSEQELSISETKINQKKKSNCKKENASAEDDIVINKKEFVIELLTTFRHPSENLPDLFDDVMGSEYFNGSNFFSIKGYGHEWL